LADADGATILPHGAGRSYGDVALNSAGRALLTDGLDRILDFDAASGEVVCEAGVTFCDLMEAYLPRGYLFPVSRAAPLQRKAARSWHRRRRARALMCPFLPAEPG
jgi:FAD/FMN-containing dehydrogenase